MAHKRILWGMVGLGLFGLGAYARRRSMLARVLKLPPPRFQVEVEYGIRVPMRDGIALVADHYAPKSSGPFPTVVMRTPYGRGSRSGVLGLVHIFSARRFAERGYHVIVQDTRGRFDSEGEFEPFVNEEKDGRDTLDWIARQSWFDGNLGMWGQSYGGYVQWAVAEDAPPYLKALVPSITGSQLSPYAGSAFGVDTILRWIYNLSRGGLPGQRWEDLQRLFNPQIAERAVRPAFDHLPLGEMDALVVGHTLPYFRKWLAHAHLDDAFWKSIYYGTRMDRVTARVHLISGWYDILLHQLLDDYEALCAAGHTPYLTIGPWRHPDVAGAAEALRSGILWMDAQLKGIHRRLRTRPVRLYVMSASRGEWREFDRFPPSTSEARFYLHSEARLDTAAPESNESLPDRYCYDPADPTPSLGGPLYHREGGSRDNRGLEARHDVLTYTSAPLAADLEVIGRVRMELFADSSAVSADFFARLCDVHPDGRSMNVCDGLVRVETKGDTSQPGGFAIVVDMWATAYRFVTGHRLRLQVSSGAYPRWDRNLGTGEPISTATRMVTAEQTIYHDPAHPSAIVLPVAMTVDLASIFMEDQDVQNGSRSTRHANLLQVMAARSRPPHVDEQP